MEEKRKSFGFQGFEMKRPGIAPLGLQKRTSLEPPVKVAKKIRPISPPSDGKSSADTLTLPDLSTPPPRRAMYSRRSTGSSYTPPFPSTLGRTSADGSTPSPRLLFKTKVDSKHPLWWIQGIHEIDVIKAYFYVALHVNIYYGNLETLIRPKCRRQRHFSDSKRVHFW